MEQQELVKMFDVGGKIADMREYGSGHINRTQLVEMEQDGQKKKYIFQQINTDIFHNVDELMENIVGVTDYLRKKLRHAQATRTEKRCRLCAHGTAQATVVRKESAIGCIILLRMHSAMTWCKDRMIFMKVRWRLERFRHCWQIIRRIHCMRPFRIFIIRQSGFERFVRR